MSQKDVQESGALNRVQCFSIPHQWECAGDVQACTSPSRDITVVSKISERVNAGKQVNPKNSFILGTMINPDRLFLYMAHRLHNYLGDVSFILHVLGGISA
jgi:hypothetical protein